MRLRPDTRAARLEQVDLAALRQAGVQALLVDADNTLTTWNNQELSAGVCAWLCRAREMGFRLCIVSNNRPERLQPLERALGLPVIACAGKPLPFGVRRAARALHTPPGRCALIGDQLFTDILAGKLAGMHTVLVEPIDTSREFAFTKVNRWLERAWRR